MIWVPSKMFFAFTKRRLQDLEATQMLMSRSRPSNFGLSTTIIMHLIRTVCHAPEVRMAHLKRALTALHFEGSSARFGMFFLHSMSFEQGFIDDIEWEDDSQCKAYYEKNVPKASRRRKAVIPQRHRYADPMEFPLGRTPTWLQWNDGMAQEPQLMVNLWSYNKVWGDALDQEVAGLFLLFTRHYIGSLRQELLTSGIPVVDDLKQAMNVWTVKELRKLVVNPFFVPSSHGLCGKTAGAKDTAFGERVKSFFPKPKPDLQKTVWKPFLQVGYLHRYHLICTDKSKKRSFDQALAGIFSQLQCLPVMTPNKMLWKTSAQGDIHFVVNSNYFKLEGVGAGPKFANATKAPRAKATNAAIELTIRTLNGDAPPSWPEVQKAQEDHQEQQRVKAATNARSGKAKNARVPPPRIQGFKKAGRIEPNKALISPLKGALAKSHVPAGEDGQIETDGLGQHDDDADNEDDTQEQDSNDEESSGAGEVAAIRTWGGDHSEDGSSEA